MSQLSRAELIEWVERIMNAEGSEAEIDEWLTMVKQHVPHPEISNLIFWNEEDWTATQIVDEALAYQPIILPPPSNTRC